LEKNGTIKLGDFGIAKVLEQTVAQANTQVGTPYYISPEIIKGRQYSFETDIWSLGIILYEMCALDVPIKAKNLHELYMKISSCKGVPPLPSRYSQELQDLVNEILVAEPKKRPTVNQILKKDLLKERVRKYLNANEFEEEFSHTILHNQYLFDRRKNRAKPSAQIKPQPVPQMVPPAPTPPREQESPFIIKSMAPSPKEQPWVKHSPRAMAGAMPAQKVLSSRKNDSASKPGYRPYSAKYSSNQKKKPLRKPEATPKGLVIQGAEIKPTVVKHDHKRRVADLLEEENNKLARERERLEQKMKLEQEERAKNNKIKERINNIYKIDRLEEQKVLNDNQQHKPGYFAEKPLANQLNWMKPGDESLESSKENNPFGEENKRNSKEVHAREKINKYRKSILKMLDSETEEEPDGLDGLETNREVSEEGERDDDNILDGTSKSMRSIKIEQTEEEKELDLDDVSEPEPEPVPIGGKPYFQTCEAHYIDPLQVILKGIMIEKYGVENTDKGIEFLKTKGTEIYLEGNRETLMQDFRKNCFENTEESVLEFISTVSSFLSYN
jgi:NIMA (never in mitosis gene a)-related kinase